MATGATLKAFQSQYQALNTLCCTYEGVHSQLIRALRTSLALLARLKSLASATLLDKKTPTSTMGGRDGYGHGAQVDHPATGSGRSGRSGGVDGLTPLLVQKTLARLTRVAHTTIPDILDELMAVTKSMRTVKRQAQELNSRLRKSASEKVMVHRCGPIPSIRQCVDGVEKIVEMHDRETRLCILFAGRERGFLDGVSYMCLDDDGHGDEAGASWDGRGGRGGGIGRRDVSDGYRGVVGRDGVETLLDACSELVDVLAGLEARKVHVAQTEMMHTVLATVDV